MLTISGAEHLISLSFLLSLVTFLAIDSWWCRNNLHFEYKWGESIQGPVLKVISWDTWGYFTSIFYQSQEDDPYWATTLALCLYTQNIDQSLNSKRKEVLA